MLPFIHIFGRPVPMYGLMMVTGMLLGSIFMVYYCKTRVLMWENALLIGVCGLGLGLLGAKLLFIVTYYSPSEFFALVKNLEFKTLLEGGLVFYGGLIFGIFGALLGAKIAHVKLSSYECAILPVIPFTHAFGRIGCFCAGCCYGAPTKSVLGVIYKNAITDVPEGIPLFPIQLLESAILFVISAIMMVFCKKLGKYMLSFYLVVYGIARLFLEQFRYDKIRGIYFGLSTSSWISIVLIAAGTILFFIRRRKRTALDNLSK